MKRRVATAALASLACAASARPSLAAEWPNAETKALPCRPTIACTADLVPPGAFEIESGYLYRKIASGAGTQASQRSAPFLLKLTLAPWVQVQAGSNGYGVARGALPSQYLDDATLGVKAHLVDQSLRAPSLALSATASVPTFAAQLGYVRTYDALFTAYATKDFGPLHVDLNAGINVWRIEGAPLPQSFAALAFSTNLSPPFGIMAETYAFSDAAPVAARDGGVLVAHEDPARAEVTFVLAAAIAFADSAIADEENDTLSMLAEGLGIDESRANALLDSVEADLGNSKG
jgi:hypothetical protein